MSEVVYELNCHSCGNEYTLSFEQELIEGAEPLYCPFCSVDTDLSDLDDDECFDDRYKDFHEESFGEED
ncbi:hypothetical protein HN803_07470 [candidate division WWE3 bacterium]|jgi:DNA-directed RNA polymerase subunit RPC12/RpoP|nr:hypothetical protein [candidate division WWE3 bacterium]